jgi:hypothetical protein
MLDEGRNAAAAGLRVGEKRFELLAHDPVEHALFGEAPGIDARRGTAVARGVHGSRGNRSPGVKLQRKSVPDGI